MTSDLAGGGCHCGAVRFRVRLRTRTALRCNCSVCEKKGFVHVIVAHDDFELEKGAGSLTEYRFNSQVAKHLFCKFCGVQSYYVPRSHPNGFSVNLSCLDEWRALNFMVKPFDGANWEQSVDAIR